ncbi:MAG: tryptophan--tRNA ligase [Myxococcota bacterium]
MTRYLSGIQASGIPHIGNYFGAIEQHVTASKELPPGDSAFFFIADYHALTTISDRETLRRFVRTIAATYLACGLDVKKAVFFRQSDVPEVTELTWLLATCTGMGLLERAHSYKDKVAKGLSPNVGLFTYPILMAADILIYDSDVVPVGKDQQQHVEMTQDMAGYFNQRFGQGKELLKYPRWVFSRTPTVPGVDGEKMSKSYGNTIDMFLEGNELKKAVNRIVTDSREPAEPKEPEGIPSLTILELFLNDQERQEWRERVRKGGEGAPGYGHMKKEIMARMDARFGPARAAYKRYLEDPVAEREMEEILVEGGKRARAVAREVLARCYDAVGITNRARP